MKDRKLRFRKKEKYKNLVFAIICVSLVFIASGMALIHSTLSVNGTTAMGKINWDIHFANLAIKEGSMEAVVPATIDSEDKTKINFSLMFDDPKDYYEFDVDVVNAGSIDAMVSDIKISGLVNNLKTYMIYDVRYSDGTKIKLNDILAKGESKKIKLLVKFKENVNLANLFKDTDINLDLSFELEYVQLNDNKKEEVVLAEQEVDILGQTMTAYMDNVKSPFVTSETGVTFSTVSSDTNGKGLYIMSGTENDEYPIYYYRGSITNNNVLFANKCWKIVRTTETGGTKLIYSGEPKSNNANGICANTGKDVELVKGKFNSSYNSLIDVGYMYSDSRYETFYQNMSAAGIIEYPNVPLEQEEYNILTNDISYPYSFDLNTKKWTSTNHDNYTSSIIEFSVNVAGEYYLIYDASLANLANAYIYVDGVQQKKIIFSSDRGYLNLNLNSSSRIKVEYVKENGLAYGKDEISFSVAKVADGEVVDNRWAFGSSVDYINGKYVLKDIGRFNQSSFSIKNKHYTCFSVESECEEIKYVYNSGGGSSSRSAHYFILSGGDKIEDALDKMFSSDNDKRNAHDSIIKDYIENTWYANNMLSYDNYLEDTVWCNDRSIYKLNGFDSSSTILGELEFNTKNRTSFGIYSPSLICENPLDRFTVSSENGNGKSKYKVGLLTLDEMMLAGFKYNSLSQTYLRGDQFWTMSPSGIGSVILVDSGMNGAGTTGLVGVRPAISLHSGVVASGGTGTVDDPYIIED